MMLLDLRWYNVYSHCTLFLLVVNQVPCPQVGEELVSRDRYYLAICQHFLPTNFRVAIRIHYRDELPSSLC